MLAPPDDAFSKLPPGTLDSILKNKTAAESKGHLQISIPEFCLLEFFSFSKIFTGVVTYHLIGGSKYKAALLPYNTSHPGIHDTFLPTLEGGQLVFSVETDGKLIFMLYSYFMFIYTPGSPFFVRVSQNLQKE